MLNDATLQLASAIEVCDNLHEIQDKVRAFSKQFGYDRFALFSISATLDGIIEHIYWIEGEWFENGSIDAHTYMRRCPVTRHILEVNEPFFWVKTTENDNECYQIMRTPRGDGIHGLQIPFYGPLGLEGAMSLGGTAIDSSSQARLAMTMISTSAFYAARKCAEGTSIMPMHKLTQREIEALSWVAIGKRQADIAAAMNISPRTVENHLRSARRRLGVATTAEAIRVAIRNGYIQT